MELKDDKEQFQWLFPVLLGQPPIRASMVRPASPYAGFSSGQIIASSLRLFSFSKKCDNLFCEGKKIIKFGLYDVFQYIDI